MRLLARLLSPGLAVFAGSAALAGPPYVSDDPEPTDLGHYEIYLFTEGTATVNGSSGSGGIDFNFGAARDLQLTAVFPIAYEGSAAGFGNVELAAKYRFLHQSQSGWDVAVFPRLFLPSGSNQVGERHASLLLPVWLERDWDKWSTFGGGGCAFDRGGESQDYCVAGWALARQVSPALQIGAELVYQTSPVRGGRAATSLGGGLRYDLTQHYQPAGVRRSRSAERQHDRSLFLVRRIAADFLSKGLQVNQANVASKVPAVTLGFWIIKILATTLGETGGDTLSMTMNLGYLTSTAIFLTAFIVLVAFQIRAKRFVPALYWATIVASTTAGTTMADFADRSLGIGYAGGSAGLLVCVLGILALWHWSEGSVSVNTVHTPRVEAFYWATITFSQTLGTALGDWMADDTGLGYEGAALVFGAALALVAAAYFWTQLSRVWLFWAAFILTRPLGATVGDFLDKPLAQGGLALSRPLASLVIAALMIICISLIRQRPADQE